MKPDYVVVGAGPAGALFAYLASQRGYTVIVYEAAPSPGLKPCGSVVPRIIEKVFKPPREYIVNVVKGFRVYLDGTLVGERQGDVWGYHIDKKGLLEYLLSSSDLKLRSPVRIVGGKLVPLRTPNTQLEAREAVVVAAGPLWPEAPQERIFAVQVRVKLRNAIEPSIIELWFDSSLVGYYWVFPEDEYNVKVGVGGFEEPKQLIDRLNKFLAQLDERYGIASRTRVRDSPIVSSKPRLEDVYTRHVIGEAAGFVMPISGEGIRPSMLSSKALFEYLETGRKDNELHRLGKWIERQYKLLNVIKQGNPELRAKVLRVLPLDLAVSIALGEASLTEILRCAVKIRSLSKVLRLLAS